MGRLEIVYLQKYAGWVVQENKGITAKIVFGPTDDKRNAQAFVRRNQDGNHL